MCSVWVNSEEIDTLNSHVIALCADYSRREEVIKSKRASYRVLMTYRFLNYRILQAAMSVAGARDAPIFIREIGLNTGYANSKITLSEKVYKIRKLEVKNAISKSLGLSDEFDT